MNRVTAADAPDWLSLDDEGLLAECDVHAYKSSGPGGQHRNKVSSAVRLRHRPTGITAHGDDSRSQHENKQLAVTRLRMAIALQVRREVNREGLAAGVFPAVVVECRFVPRGRGLDATPRLEIGRKDHRFWHVAQFLLDVLEDCEGRLSDASGLLGISTGNLGDLLGADRHLFGAACEIRKRHGQRSLR